MSVEQIMYVLKKYGTFEQTPQQTQDAYEELRGYSESDTTQALRSALSSGNEDLVLFTLTLIEDFYAECTGVLPEVRYLLINGTSLEQAASMTVVFEMRDTDKKTEEALRRIMSSGDRLMHFAAAATLLHCFDCAEARRFLEQRRDDEDALWHLNRCQYQTRQATENDAEAIHGLLTMCTHAQAKLIRSLRETDQIAFECVANFGGELVGHIAFVHMASEEDEPLDATLMVRVFVHPAHRRMGIGSELVAAGMKVCKKRGLKVVPGQSEFLWNFFS